ncbi:phage tail tube protein [Undibacterium sp.]|uniref:phage tail tube protein n=1 Tax=Undibacterium sp. TaxID=1914977 RepID=UPI00375181FE
MSKLYKSIVVLAALQSVNGVAATLDGTKALFCSGVQPRPAVVGTEDRKNIKAHFGHSGSVVTNVYSEVEFQVELAASGAAGVAPKWGHLMRACAMSETITPTTSVVYAPVTSNVTDQLTIEVFIDGIRHRMIDAKGTVSVELKSKSISLLTFKFTGLYVAAADAPMPTGVDYSDFTDPVPVNFTNTPTWTLHGESGALESVSIDWANQVSYRNLIGQQGIRVTDRLPTGNVLLEMGAIADKNWFDSVIKADLGEFNIVHGTVAGHIIEIDAPKVQLSEPSYSDSDGVLMIGMKTMYKPDLGNDELILTLR